MAEINQPGMGRVKIIWSVVETHGIRKCKNDDIKVYIIFRATSSQYVGDAGAK
ncbi:MAG: hypothetical protein QXZ47_05000 [Candidatus Bathyarchaeia archaeon]